MPPPPHIYRHRCHDYVHVSGHSAAVCCNYCFF